MRVADWLLSTDIDQWGEQDLTYLAVSIESSILGFGPLDCWILFIIFPCNKFQIVGPETPFCIPECDMEPNPPTL